MTGAGDPVASHSNSIEAPTGWTTLGGGASLIFTQSICGFGFGLAKVSISGDNEFSSSSSMVWPLMKTVVKTNANPSKQIMFLEIHILSSGNRSLFLSFLFFFVLCANLLFTLY